MLVAGILVKPVERSKLKPYSQEWGTIYHSDCREILPQMPDNSMDLLATDPPYGIGMMGKDWDKALPDKAIWAECLRILKPGAFAFVMSIPRADCLSRMIIALEDAGFRVDFSPIYHCFASGFPKSQNIGKAVDKRLGVEPVGKKDFSRFSGIEGWNSIKNWYEYPDRQTPQAQALDGSYGGFQPKPAVEVIIVAMKPLSEKTFVDQALKNRKGITWLDDCRIPIEKGDEPHGGYGDEVIGFGPFDNKGGVKWKESPTANKGRFPANLLVSDDVLNDGKVRKSGRLLTHHQRRGKSNLGKTFEIRDRTGEPADWGGDSGSFSRYFDLDKWWEERIKQLPQSVQRTFPFLIVPKASKSEKEKLLDMPRVVKSGLPLRDGSSEYVENVGGDGSQSTRRTQAKNIHPTVKPLKLMAYLITLGSREGDIVLDPFLGSGTTILASKMLGRKCVGIELEEEYCRLAVERCRQQVLL